MPGLHAQIRGRGLSIFLDLRLMARAIRARVPLAVARRQAEYVLIDHARVHLGFDDADFMARHLARVERAHHGLGFTNPGTTRVERLLQPARLPSLEVRIALKREGHADTS